MITDLIRNKKRLILFFILLDILVMAIIFSQTGLYNLRIDAKIYTAQIRAFNLGQYDLTSRIGPYFFKPFYGVIGSWLVPPLNPYQAILVLNILLLFGLTIVSYFFYKELGFEDGLARAGTVLTIFSYAMLKYGLAISTDIAGWFFCLTVILISLLAVKYDKIRLIALAGLIGFLGSLAKETGVLGMIFSGVFIVFQFGKWGTKKVFTWLAALCTPFIILETVFLLLMKIAGAHTFIQWYASNNSGYAPQYYKLHYFLGVQGSAFNIILLFSLLGLWYAVKSRDIIRLDWLKYYLPLFLASTPIFLWPIFISRVLFIQFIFLVPLTLYGISKLDKNIINMRIFKLPVMTYLLALPPIISLATYIMCKNGSLFDIVKSLY